VQAGGVSVIEDEQQALEVIDPLEVDGVFGHSGLHGWPVQAGELD